MIPNTLLELGCCIWPPPIYPISGSNAEQIHIVLNLLEGKATSRRLLMAGEYVGPRFLGIAGIYPTPYGKIDRVHNHWGVHLYPIGFPIKTQCSAELSIDPCGLAGRKTTIVTVAGGIGYLISGSLIK